MLVHFQFWSCSDELKFWEPDDLLGLCSFLLTIPPSVGYEQNPLSLYYCYDLDGSARSLEKCIAEVCNFNFFYNFTICKSIICMWIFSSTWSLTSFHSHPYVISDTTPLLREPNLTIGQCTIKALRTRDINKMKANGTY